VREKKSGFNSRQPQSDHGQTTANSRRHTATKKMAEVSHSAGPGWAKWQKMWLVSVKMWPKVWRFQNKDLSLRRKPFNTVITWKKSKLKWSVTGSGWKLIVKNSQWH
jgi:hypothetical protein